MWPTEAGHEDSPRLLGTMFPWTYSLSSGGVHFCSNQGLLLRLLDLANTWKEDDGADDKESAISICLCLRGGQVAGHPCEG